MSSRYVIGPQGEIFTCLVTFKGKQVNNRTHQEHWAQILFSYNLKTLLEY